MGSYADPKMIVDKRFEKVRGELDKLYKNVEGNLQLIAKRKQARKAADAKKYGGFGDIYNKAVKESRTSSRKFARTRPDMAKQAKKEFSDQIANKFNEGYDNIQAFVRGQYISKEGEQPIKNPTESQVNAFVQSQIDAANNLGESLVTFEQLANEHSEGVRAGQGSTLKGSNAGSVVIGGEFSNIFSAMTDDSQDDIQWSKMKLQGSLTDGVSVYFDAQTNYVDGKLVQSNDPNQGVMESNEVIDLSVARKNYMNGNTEAYLQKIKPKGEIAEGMKGVVKTLQDNKAFNFTEQYNTVDDNGNPLQMKVVNKRKTQDYFIEGKGSAITLDAMIEQHGGITATVQAYFGADIAKDFPDPTEKGYDQSMLKLKARMYEDLDPLISDGDKNMLRPNKENISRQYTKDTGSKVVRGFYEEVHGEVGRLLPTLPNDTEAMNDFNLYIQNRPYSQGGKTYTIDHMEPATPGSSDMVLIMKDGNKIKPEEGYFKLNDKGGRHKLEQGLMKGNFQGTTDRRHVDGFYNSDEFGGENKEAYNGSEKESVRITNSEVAGGITYQQYLDKVEGSEKELNHNTIDWPWEPDGLGGGSQAVVGDNVNTLGQPTGTVTANATQASVTTGPVDQAEEMKDVEVKTQDITGAENAAKPDDDPTKTMKYGELSETSFGGKDYEETGRVGEKAVYKNDNSLDDQYRKIINFETIGGATGGSGVGAYGFTDPKYAGKEPKSPEEAVEMIKKEIVPKVEKDLGFKLDELDSIPKNITASLVDYKMNTGRSMDDLLVIAYQNQQAIGGEKVNKIWDGISAVRKNAPKPSKEVYDALKSGKISAEAIAAAKDELYLGRIKEMQNNNSPKLEATIEAYRNSHSNRVNMFK